MASAAEFESKDNVATCVIEKELGDRDDSYSPYSESVSKKIIIDLYILNSTFGAFMQCKMCYSYLLIRNVNNNAGFELQFYISCFTCNHKFNFTKSSVNQSDNGIFY